MLRIADHDRALAGHSPQRGWGGLFETVTDLESGADTIRQRRYGVIETAEGRLVSIRFRPFPKFASLPDVYFFGPRMHERRKLDRCKLYFNQPLRYSNFLSLSYVCSGGGARTSTFISALSVLDEVARIKNSDAILADVLNFRITPRFLARYGWEPHKQSRWHRHYIKRFYGGVSGKRLRAGRLRLKGR